MLTNGVHAIEAIGEKSNLQSIEEVVHSHDVGKMLCHASDAGCEVSLLCILVDLHSIP